MGEGEGWKNSSYLFPEALDVLKVLPANPDDAEQQPVVNWVAGHIADRQYYRPKQAGDRWAKWINRTDYKFKVSGGEE